MKDIDKLTRKISDLEDQLERVKRTQINTSVPAHGFSGEKRLLKSGDGVYSVVNVEGTWYKVKLEKV